MDPETPEFPTGRTIATIVFGMGLAIGTCSALPPNISSCIVHERGEDKPRVMRCYRKAGRDAILVESTNHRGSYMSLNKYLEGFSEADQEILDAEIRKAVGWYEK